MKNKNKVSFVIPAYNCEKTIIDSIESITKGNFEPGDEIVIVNDASTDKTVKTIESFIKKNLNLNINLTHHKINKGSAAAGRNTAIDHTKNNIIFCLDADNILAPNSIKKLKEYLLINKAEAAAFQELYYFIENKNKVTHKWAYPNKIITLNDALSGNYWPGPSGNYMFTKESWIKSKRYHESVNGAYDSWAFGIRQLAVGTKMVVLPNTGYYHRYGYNSTFIRDHKKENSSLIALQVLIPFLNQINEKDVEYIFKKKNRYTWFTNLNKHPIKIKGQEYNQNKKVLYLFNIKTTIKKLIIYITKKLKIYHILKKNFIRINFKKEFHEFKRLTKKNKRFSILWKDKYPCLHDKTLLTKFDTHYIYHPAWATRILEKTKPKKHTDISSTLHFCSIISAFIPVEFYDFRPAKINLNNLISKKANLTSLPFGSNSIKSLSCMHTIEHIGLGRYGDKLDPNGDLKAIKELKRVLTPDGNLLFVVPVGQPRIMFNAHRIYSYEQIIEYFNDFELKDFSLVTDQGNFIQNSNKKTADKQKYGCGCFWFKK